MKINSNSNYIIFENKLQQFMLKNAGDFIQEIHFHTSQNEIIGIITYLKQNIIDQKKYLLKQYLKNNDLINVSRMNEEIQNIQLPSKLHIILNVPHITLEYDLIPIETNPNTYVRKFA